MIFATTDKELGDMLSQWPCASVSIVMILACLSFIVFLRWLNYKEDMKRTEQNHAANMARIQKGLPE